MRRTKSAALFGLVLALVAGQASAAGDADVTLAREKVKEGVAAANGGRWEDARVAFTEAYRLYPRPSILFNLAGAEVQTGHVLAGIDAYRKVLADPDGLTRAQVTLAEGALRASEGRVAYLTIHVPSTRCKAALDDVAIGIDEERAVDPGTHHATLVCTGAQYADRREITVEAGQKRTIALHEPGPAPVPMTATPAPASSDASPIRVLGIVLAAGAVGALGASAVTGGIGYVKHGDFEDTCGRTKTCNPDDVQNARTLVTISDVTLIAGIVLAAGAAYALLVHPRLTSKSASSGGSPFSVSF